MPSVANPTRFLDLAGRAIPGLAAASLTVAGLGLIGTLVMAFVVVETLRKQPL